jgi:hypothetical protein
MLKPQNGKVLLSALQEPIFSLHIYKACIFISS